MPATAEVIAQTVHHLAGAAGFQRVGIAAAGPLPRAAQLQEWLAAGRAGGMDYLARHAGLRADPRQLLPGARSIIVVADLYGPPQSEPAEAPAADQASGRIARYAWGRDYHRVLRRKLQKLADTLHAEIAEPFQTRICVDTAPIVEREWAAIAGIGWIGKNTMVLSEKIGSYFFLGEIITTLELAPSTPAVDRCGTCTRCLDACPTGALDEPYRMDARRCISYLTIEHRHEIAAELQPLMGDWVYGCDICQQVCPYNRQAPPGDPAYDINERNPLPPRASLAVLQHWAQDDYDRHLAGSAMRRASLAMLKRNAAIAQANQGGEPREQGPCND